MRDQHELVQLIDRYRLGRAQRLGIGLSVDEDFRIIRGTLLLTEGRGKWLRPRWVEQKVFEVSDSLRKNCCELTKQNNIDAAEFVQLRVDLTRLLAAAAEDLKTLSGKSSQMLMTLCVADPGIWPQDYDGKRGYESFCEASCLAELTGISVVDSLPQRDLANGGRGQPIEPLANWLLHSDRNEKVAEHPRVMVDLRSRLQLTYLPESDGLDDELPQIRTAQFPGLAFESRLLGEFGFDAAGVKRRDQIRAQGKVHTELLRNWDDCYGRLRIPESDGTSDSDELEDRLVASAKTVLAGNSSALPDLLRCLTCSMASQIRGFANQCRPGLNKLQLIAAGTTDQHGLLINELDRILDRIPWFDGKQFNHHPANADSAATAMLGMMHLDQMPASLPWLTGGGHPRVLGRLTPGRPSNWRRVIMEMADYRPPVMRLRDAV